MMTPKQNSEHNDDHKKKTVNTMMTTKQNSEPNDDPERNSEHNDDPETKQ